MGPSTGPFYFMMPAVTKHTSDLRDPCMQSSTERSRVTKVAVQHAAIALFATACMLVAWLDFLQGTLQGSERWRIGDWLIHWEAGPVRRGLWGEMLIWLTPGGAAQIWTSFVGQSLLLFATGAMVLQLYFARGARALSWLVLLLNPGFLFLFAGLDTGSAFRKELLFFFSFMCLIQGVRKPQTWAHGWLCASVVAYGIGVMSHELGSLCAPFFLLVLWQHAHTPQNAQPISLAHPLVAYGGMFLALAAGGLIFSSLHPGSAALTTGVCNVLLQRGIDGFMCTGAIDWLKVDSHEAFDKVREDWPLYRTVYPLLMALSLLPLVLVDWVRRHALVLLACLLALLPLFIFARDWGRWIHLYIFFVTVTVLWVSGRTEVRIVTVPWWTAAAFIGLWRLPHVDAELPFYGALFRSLARAAKSLVPLFQSLIS